ncbi:uncharacterized protein LOC134658156 [Cydia amplana]|uniref:uncharacterized protein LOC134658156 n=1 Tax=Cydia amplana TaxID=1869771 RepID=UPI002FE53B78
MADQISGVNEVIDEMIREHAVTHNDSNHNENKASLQLENFTDLTNLTKGYNGTKIAPTPNDDTLWSSNSSLEVDSRRIFKGSSTGIARYPFMVSVHVGGRFVCAGSLLHESLALSAATCLMRTRDDTKLIVQIRVGSDYVTKMGFLVKIDRLFFHPEFDRSTLANNLVILKTRKALRFQNKKVVAVKYDRFDHLSLIKKVKDIMILGWGRRSPSEKSAIDERPLSRARLNIYDLEECKYIYSKEYVSDMNFCAGFVDRGEGACNHDGGGPALAGSLLTGVISFGSPKCGRVDAPTVFTRIGLYADWIDRVVDSVAIAEGKLANLHTFQTPSSIDVGVPSEEIDKMELELQNPREELQREFGLKDILNGPIDKLTNGTVKPATKENDHIEIPKHDAIRSKITDEQHSDVDQIKFSDDSEEHSTIVPERPTLFEKNEKVEYAHDEGDAFANYIKSIFENGNIIETKNPVIMNSEEYEQIAILDFNPDPTITTPARPEYYNEEESTTQRFDVPRERPRQGDDLGSAPRYWFSRQPVPDPEIPGYRRFGVGASYLTGATPRFLRSLTCKGWWSDVVFTRTASKLQAYHSCEKALLITPSHTLLSSALQVRPVNDYSPLEGPHFVHCLPLLTDYRYKGLGERVRLCKTELKLESAGKQRDNYVNTANLFNAFNLGFERSTRDLVCRRLGDGGILNRKQEFSGLLVLLYHSYKRLRTSMGPCGQGKLVPWYTWRRTAAAWRPAGVGLAGCIDTAAGDIIGNGNR